jgi:DNA-binding NtrC family response regulator
MIAMAIRLAERHAHGEDPYAMARVLIIDDNTPTRHMLRQALERAGYEVADAPDGRAGMQLQRAMPADVIITDILMPEQEGLETIRELQRDFPTTKIIAISGGGQIGTYSFLAIAERLGARRALQKPFGLREMLDAVKEMLQMQD